MICRKIEVSRRVSLPAKIGGAGLPVNPKYHPTSLTARAETALVGSVPAQFLERFPASCAEQPVKPTDYEIVVHSIGLKA